MYTGADLVGPIQQPAAQASATDCAALLIHDPRTTAVSAAPTRGNLPDTRAQVHHIPKSGLNLD